MFTNYAKLNLAVALIWCALLEGQYDLPSLAQKFISALQL